MLLAEKLGIELIELTAASCCGASVVNDVNRDVARVLNARTYAQAEALGLDDVITICSTCTGHMRAANKELLESEERMDQANSILCEVRREVPRQRHRPPPAVAADRRHRPRQT